MCLYAGGRSVFNFDERHALPVSGDDNVLSSVDSLVSGTGTSRARHSVSRKRAEVLLECVERASTSSSRMS